MPRIIMYYANRKLYDTLLNKYITLKDIRNYILEDISFKIYSKNFSDYTNRIITRAVLSKTIDITLAKQILIS